MHIFYDAMATNALYEPVHTSISKTPKVSIKSKNASTLLCYSLRTSFGIKCATQNLVECNGKWRIMEYISKIRNLIEIITFIFDCSSIKLNIDCMSVRDCRKSRYTDPRKFSGTDNWNNSPFTITKSPTVIVPSSK